MTKKILVVDDEPDFVEFLSIRLESSGYDVISASDGESGLKKAQKEKPDLIILDILMPKINGFELCKRLKENELTKDMPVIMLTALTREQALSKGLKEGADCFITKPFNPVDLLDEIKTALTKKNKS
jgi:DNA-binding response OmpR family regulator